MSIDIESTTAQLRGFTLPSVAPVHAATGGRHFCSVGRLIGVISQAPFLCSQQVIALRQI